MKSTLYINLFGAPGSGKSTGAAYIFSELKMCGIDCEYVPEFAKDAVWEERKFLFEDPDCQFIIAAKQFLRLDRLFGKVDVVVTDSPLELSQLYVGGSLLDCEEYRNVIHRLSSKFHSWNFLISRTKAYNPNGRNQTEEESQVLASRIQDLLDQSQIPYENIPGNRTGYSKILQKILTERFPG